MKNEGELFENFETQNTFLRPTNAHYDIHLIMKFHNEKECNILQLVKITVIVYIYFFYITNVFKLSPWIFYYYRIRYNILKHFLWHWYQFLVDIVLVKIRTDFSLIWSFMEKWGRLLIGERANFVFISTQSSSCPWLPLDIKVCAFASHNTIKCTSMCLSHWGHS